MASRAYRRRDIEGNEYYACPYYPVGSLYLSVVDINPSTYFGGTWKKIEADAYLKIVSSNAGNLDGTSSDHKIPIESLPSHTHGFHAGLSFTGSGSDGTGLRQANDIRPTSSISNTGGGKAYYPYYLGIYVYQRTA